MGFFSLPAAQKEAAEKARCPVCDGRLPSSSTSSSVFSLIEATGTPPVAARLLGFDFSTLSPPPPPLPSSTPSTPPNGPSFSLSTRPSTTAFPAPQLPSIPSPSAAGFRRARPEELCDFCGCTRRRPAPPASRPSCLPSSTPILEFLPATPTPNGPSSSPLPPTTAFAPLAPSSSAPWLPSTPFPRVAGVRRPRPPDNICDACGCTRRYPPPEQLPERPTKRRHLCFSSPTPPCLPSPPSRPPPAPVSPPPSPLVIEIFLRRLSIKD